ncbi:hypothetical protein MMC07_006495 [Pseudocyphellaria aurata]|nr:hypothetical protein [Pseudocyphellaria aurata]
MMEFMHLFNQQRVRRRSRSNPVTFGIIPIPAAPLAQSDPRRGAFSGHEDWPWRHDCEPDFGYAYYTVTSDEPWLDDHGDFFGSPIGRVDDDHGDSSGDGGGQFPSRTSSPLENRPVSPLGPGYPHCSDFLPNRDEHAHHHHRYSSPPPVRDWGDAIMPDVFRPLGASSPPAYSVEEPDSPSPPLPSTFPGRSLPRRRQSASSSHAHVRNSYTSPLQPRPGPSQSPNPFWDPVHLNQPSSPPRCDTLPSSPRSTASTPSRHPSSPAPSPRARSPLAFFPHLHPDRDRDRDRDRDHHHHQGPTHSRSRSHQHHPSLPLPRHFHHQQQQQQQMLLSAHQRTRRHLRALEHELALLDAHDPVDAVFDHAFNRGCGNGAGARERWGVRGNGWGEYGNGNGIGERWGDGGTGDRWENWGWGGYGRGRRLGVW